MQTFLPYPSFSESARVLDRQRLGKQRVEAWQILQAMHQPAYGWQNNPAVQMWRGYEKALALYGITVCLEWIARGYNDTMLERFEYVGEGPMPPWLGDAAFHRSHQSNLIRKLPSHYLPFFPDVSDDLPYVWPA